MIRLARYEDLDGVVKVIDDAKSLFKGEGSDQWQDTDNYPNFNTMLKDYEKQELYVKLIDEKVVGCIVLSKTKEEAYDLIYDGAWLTDEDYFVIHRLAVAKEFYRTGVAKELIEYVIGVTKSYNINSIRVDTKVENARMINLLSSFNFKIVGKIDLLRKDVLDKVRLALELKM